MPFMRVLAPRQDVTPLETFGKSKRRSQSGSNAEFLYKFEATTALPVVDLRRTLSYLFLGPQDNVLLLWWLKKNFALVHFAHVIGTVLTLLVVTCPRHIGRLLGPVAAALSFVAIISQLLTASLDVLKLLARQYEFWFFSVANLLTWSLLAFFLEDALRIAGLIPLWLNVQLVIALDTNFRSFVATVRSIMLTLITLLVIVGLGFIRALDIDPSRLETKVTLSDALDIKLPLYGLFSNALSTLIPFIMRVLYNRRKLLSARSAGTKLVRCQLYRAQLVLRPVQYSRTESLGVEYSRRTHVLHKQLGISAPEMSAANGHNSAHHHQQITLVALRLSAIDSRNVLLRSWPMHIVTRRSTLFTMALYATGIAGLSLNAATFALPAGKNQLSLSKQVTPFIGFTLSLVFCAVFACAGQRNMLHALFFHNFSFLFSMLHCSVACLCLSDMLDWDYRSWAVAGTFVWFLWMQLLDAVTPPMRRQLAFSKMLLVPVLLWFWAMMFTVAYACMFLSTQRTGLAGRELFQIRVGQHTAVLNTRTMLLTRIFIMFFWMQRLAWNIFFAAFVRCWRFARPHQTPEAAETNYHAQDEEDLFVIRGSLDYFCPFDTFPGIRRRLSTIRIATSSGSSIHRSASIGRHRSRRSNSTTLLSGVILPAPVQGKQTRRSAFGQRSRISEKVMQESSREAVSSMLASAPGMIKESS